MVVVPKSIQEVSGRIMAPFADVKMLEEGQPMLHVAVEDILLKADELGRLPARGCVRQQIENRIVQQGFVTVGVVPGVVPNVNTQWKITRALQSRLEQPFGVLITMACHRTPTLDKSRRGANAARISSNGHLYD